MGDSLATTIREHAEALEAALKTVPKLEVYRDYGAVVDPPAAILGLPSLQWRSACPGPNEAVFPVYVIVASNELAQERLWDLVPSVAAAVDTVPDAAVTDAEDGAYQSGNTSLPCYKINIGVSL